MKTKFKSVHKKNKVSSKKILKKCKRINLFDAMFRKYNLDVFNKFNRNMTQIMINHHKNHSKTSAKHTDSEKSSGFNKKDIIDMFPDSEHDICSYDVYESSGSNNKDIIDILPGDEIDILPDDENDILPDDENDILPASMHDITSYLGRYSMGGGLLPDSSHNEA